MARPLRSFEPGGYYHVTARGNDDGPIFLDDLDRSRFVHLLSDVSRRFRLDIHVWCLMTSHYHLVVTSPAGVVSRPVQYLNSSHARAFNQRHGRRGHVFLQRFRASTIRDEGHLANTRDYVLDNPVRAGIVARREDWPWAGCAVGGAS
jgi:REP element-mobilizing transposase RayT